MTLKIQNRDSFVRNFLHPISRIATTVSLKTNDQESKISTVVHNSSNIFLNATYNVQIQDLENNVLCLPDVNKLIKIFQCIEQEDISVTVNKNCINYTDKNCRFKYHLFDEIFNKGESFDFNKIHQIEPWTKIELTKEKNRSILKALPFVTETSKLYLRQEADSIYAELTDKKIQNVDSYTILLTDEYTGGNITEELILDIELFRLISTLNFDKYNLYINNEFKMLKLEFNLDNCNLIFVSTSYK